MASIVLLPATNDAAAKSQLLTECIHLIMESHGWHDLLFQHSCSKYARLLPPGKHQWGRGLEKTKHLAPGNFHMKWHHTGDELSIFVDSQTVVDASFLLLSIISVSYPILSFLWLRNAGPSQEHLSERSKADSV